MTRSKKIRTKSTERSAPRHLRRLRQTRMEVATEGQHNYHAAKKKAAERIGVSERLALPSNVEVKDALRRYQGLYGGTAHQENLERLRRIAVQAMQMLDELRLYTNMAARRSIAANYRAIQTEIGNQILLAPTGFMGNVGRALRLGYGLAKFSHSGRGFAEVTCAIGAGCGVTHSWSY